MDAKGDFNDLNFNRVEKHTESFVFRKFKKGCQLSKIYRRIALGRHHNNQSKIALLRIQLRVAMNTQICQGHVKSGTPYGPYLPSVQNKLKD